MAPSLRPSTSGEPRRRDDGGRDDVAGRLLEELVAIVGEAHVLTDPDVDRRLGRSTGPAGSAGRRRPSCGPADADEVAAVVRRCAGDGRGRRAPGRQHRPGRRAVSAARRGRAQPRAGSTGSAPVDALAGQVTAGAGVTLGRAAGRSARPAGWATASTWPARDSGDRRRHRSPPTPAASTFCGYGGTRRQLLGRRGGARRRRRSSRTSAGW